MPTLQVDNRGRELYYEDSGPPASSQDEYVTVIVVHGLMVHSAIFKPMLAFADSHKLRLVLVNQREYPGSSTFFPEELEKLNSDDHDAQLSVVKGIGLELATFMARFVQTHDIPKPIGRRKGGLAVVAWSLGNMALLSFLAYGHEFPEEIRHVLDDFLRVAISYDSPGSIFGVAIPPELTSPLRNPNLTPRQRAEEFLKWISCYSNPVDSLDSVSVELLAERERKRDAGDTTYDRFSDETLASVADFSAFHKYHFIIRARDVYQESARLALYEPARAWRDLKVVALWCDRSPWITIWGMKSLADGQASRKEGVRKLQCVKVENANHFMHWEDPERMVRIIAEHVR